MKLKKVNRPQTSIQKYTEYDPHLKTTANSNNQSQIEESSDRKQTLNHSEDQFGRLINRGALGNINPICLNIV